MFKAAKFRVASVYFQLTVFLITALLSAMLNTLLIRNLIKSDLSIWVVASTITGIVSVTFTGITLKKLNQLIKNQDHGLNSSQETTTLKLNNSLFYFLTLLFLILILFFINYLIAYIILMSVLLFYNSRILAFSQFAKRQSQVILTTLGLYLLFIFSILVFKNFFNLSLFSLIVIHSIVYSIYVAYLFSTIPRNTRIFLRSTPVRLNIVFALFIFNSQVDILIVNAIDELQDKSLYSAASTYTRFGFAIISFLAFLLLDDLVRKQNFFEPLIIRSMLILSFLITFIGSVIFFIDQNIAEFIFGRDFINIFKILGPQIVSYLPWFLLYLPIQYLIATGNKFLPLIVLYSIIIEALLQNFIAYSIHSVMLIHFLIGIIVFCIVISILHGSSRKESRYFFYLGTTAEIIKLKALIRLFKFPVVLNTSQHNVSYFDVLSHLNSDKVREIYTSCNSSKALEDRAFKPLWLIERLVFTFVLFLKIRVMALIKREQVFLIIHGDTLSSTMGGLLGFIFGFKIAHVEAGLRSGSILNPLPEEFFRRINSNISTYHFSPNLNSLKNLEKYDGRKFNTKANTFIDSIDFKFITKKSLSHHEKYVVVHLHRFEFIQNKELIQKTFISLERIALNFKIYFIVDSQSKNILKNFPHGQPFSSLRCIDKFIDRNEFLRFCFNSQFVITDSGGLQEELALFGVPTLIHRKFTERNDGLGQNIKLSQYNCDTIEKFAKEYKTYRSSINLVKLKPSLFISKVLKNEK